MDNYDFLLRAISTVGFPIVVTLILIYKDYKFTSRLVRAEEAELQVLAQLKELMSIVASNLAKEK